MKLLSISAAIVFAVSAAALADQGGSGASTASRAAVAARSITLTGCIQSADPAGAPSGAAGGSASSGSTSDPAAVRPNGSSFVLANAAIAPAANAARGKGAAAAPRYLLEGDGLAPHLNQQVEVVGTVLPVDAAPAAAGTFGSGASSTAAPGNTGAPRADDSSHAPAVPRLHVRSVRVVSSNCGQP